MMVRYYSVFDKAACAFLNPFPARAPGEALRLFENTVLDPKSDIGRNAKDYVLYSIGIFDDASGKFTMVDHGPLEMISALEVRNSLSADLTMLSDKVPA